MITHSYVTTVLESYEISRRQVRHLARILPENWELVFVDDGSVPEIPIPDERPRNTTVIRTNDRRHWTQGIARNRAAREAQGEYLLFCDIDHVFTAAAIEVAGRFEGDMLHWFRQRGELNEDLRIELDIAQVYDRSPNTFLIRAEFFAELGGYIAQPGYGEDIGFLRSAEEHLGHPIPQDRTAPIYVTDLTPEQGHQLRRPW